jgi:surfeit locus 1 family protein
MTALALALLVSLGNWQMRRLAWKEGLIAGIAERKDAPPVPVSEVEWRARAGGDVEYTRVKAMGRLQNDKELHLYAFDEGSGPGYHVITPLLQADGSVVLVNRGFVPQDLKDSARRQAGQLAGDVEIIGLVRRPETQGAFVPDNDVGRNTWYWRDLDGMAAAALAPNPPRTVPFFIDAAADPPNPGGWPKGGVTRLELPNRHLEYALTWYGLAAALVAVFAVFSAGRWRRPTP